MVYIDNEPIGHISSLSERHQIILSMIPEGTDWLRWAMRDKNIPPVQAKDETQLLEIIQQGLHSDQYIRFDTFRVVLDKLIKMPKDDLKELSRHYRDGYSNSEKLDGILKNNMIFTYNDLAPANAFIAGMNKVPNWIFPDPDLHDLILITWFLPEWNKTDQLLQDPAVNFAVTKAATVPEFIDLCNFYVYTAQNQFPEGSNFSTEIQTKEIRHYYERLFGILPPLLFAPSIGPGHSEEEMRKRIQSITASGKILGYSSIAAGASNLALNINFADEDTLRDQAGRYMDSVRNAVANSNIPEGKLVQDGSMTLFDIQTPQLKCGITADKEGNILILPQTRFITNETKTAI